MSYWKYYNHAVVPTAAPHEVVDTTDVENGSIFKLYPKALLARWTTDWDCGYETNWWYIIKDTPFQIMDLKAKHRYEINKGFRYFEVSEFSLEEKRQSVAEVYEAALESYKRRIPFDKEAFIKDTKPQDRNIKYYGAFEKETGRMCAFCYLRYQGQCAHYVSHKAIPCYEKQSVNAALVAGMLELNSNFLHNGYICDGARSINHETAFQDYLEKYFGFRKAYCILQIRYPKFLGGGCQSFISV